MAEEFRCQYDEMEKVAAQFAKQSEAINSMLQKVRGSMNNLKSGWIGRGSEAFFAEMQNTVLPASTRLKTALQEGSAVTKNIVQTVKTAEQEASAPFKTS